MHFAKVYCCCCWLTQCKSLCDKATGGCANVGLPLKGTIKRRSFMCIYISSKDKNKYQKDSKNCILIKFVCTDHSNLAHFCTIFKIHKNLQNSHEG